MQTVNEVRLAILQNFLDDVSAALQDESDPEDLRWRIGEIEGTYHSALDAAMPKVGDHVVVEHIVLIDGDTDVEIEYYTGCLGMRGRVQEVWSAGVTLRGGDGHLASYDEVTLCK